jgi:hypothetical protein
MHPGVICPRFVPRNVLEWTLRRNQAVHARLWEYVMIRTTSTLMKMHSTPYSQPTEFVSIPVAIPTALLHAILESSHWMKCKLLDHRKKWSSSAAGEDATGKIGAQSDSDDGSRRPTKVQKKLRLTEDTTGPRWACPFYKFNDTVYATCDTWSTKRIETIKRHVLGRKHDSSPDMDPIKALRVRSLGVFRHDENRWRAIYSKLFDVSREPLHSVPSPYWSATVVVVTDVAAVTAPSPLPTS